MHKCVCVHYVIYKSIQTYTNACVFRIKMKKSRATICTDVMIVVTIVMEGEE